jgi:hypothetical protein
LTTQNFSEFLINDLEDLLRWVERAGNFRTDGALFDTTNKSSHYWQGNVSFKKCNAQILASSIDISVSKTTLAAQAFKGGG